MSKIDLRGDVVEHQFPLGVCVDDPDDPLGRCNRLDAYWGFAHGLLTSCARMIARIRRCVEVAP
jgi:hypothetical protein